MSALRTEHAANSSDPAAFNPASHPAAALTHRALKAIVGCRACQGPNSGQHALSNRHSAGSMLVGSMPVGSMLVGSMLSHAARGFLLGKVFTIVLGHCEIVPAQTSNTLVLVLLGPACKTVQGRVWVRMLKVPAHQAASPPLTPGCPAGASPL